MCRGWLRIAVVHVPAAPISEAAIPIPWALRTVLSPAKSQRQHITEWEWARQIVAKGFAPELAVRPRSIFGRVGDSFFITAWSSDGLPSLETRAPSLFETRTIERPGYTLLAMIPTPPLASSVTPFHADLSP